MGCFSWNPETTGSDSGGSAVVWRLPSEPTEYTDRTADSCDVRESAPPRPGIFGAAREACRKRASFTKEKTYGVSVGISLRVDGEWRHVQEPCCRVSRA